ncbi:MAG: alpha/beta fold hydrolase [Elainellaceae cyanobacterium]
MTLVPGLLALDTITAVAGNDTALFPIRLWDYGTVSAPLAETVLMIHGRQGVRPNRDQNLAELYPRLAALATQLVGQGKRVLFLDWGEAAVDNLPPFDAAERIKPVADWAADQLQGLGLADLTLIGHSLGSYVAAQVAQAMPQPSTHLIALDPAFPAQNYDIDGLTDDQQAVTAFSQAGRSLAFVAEDDIFQTGLAGDNAQAGTADTSFVVELDGLQGILDAAAAHGAVIEVYRDFGRYLQPGDSATSWVLAQFPRDRIGNSGGRSTDGPHEGVVDAAQVDDVWRIADIKGDGVALHFIHQTDAIADLTSDGDRLDIVASLVSLQLSTHFEHLVLGGNANLDGTGNELDNRLYGNWGDNRLQGRTGDDQVYGAGGDDTLVGNRGADRLLGQGGMDRLLGDIGDDLLVGGTGADTLAGGAGNDQLRGGFGADRLRGGAGQDHFWLEAAGGIDIIQDFQDGIDQLVLPSGVLTAAVSVTTFGSDTLLAIAGEAIALISNIAVAQLGPMDFAASDPLVA